MAGWQVGGGHGGARAARWAGWSAAVDARAARRGGTSGVRQALPAGLPLRTERSTRSPARKRLRAGWAHREAERAGGGASLDAVVAAPPHEAPVHRLHLEGGVVPAVPHSTTGRGTLASGGCRARAGAGAGAARARAGGTGEHGAVGRRCRLRSHPCSHLPHAALAFPSVKQLVLVGEVIVCRVLAALGQGRRWDVPRG